MLRMGNDDREHSITDALHISAAADKTRHIEARERT